MRRPVRKKSGASPTKGHSDKSALKKWRREYHELHRKKKVLGNELKRVQRQEDTEERAQRIEALEREIASVLAKIEGHKEEGARRKFTVGNPKSGKSRRLLSPEEIEKLERQIAKVRAELEPLVPGFHADRIRELEREKNRLLRTLRAGKPPRKGPTWKRWSKGPGKVRFYRGRSDQ